MRFGIVGLGRMGGDLALKATPVVLPHCMVIFDAP
jgi:hypothetical protein